MLVGEPCPVCGETVYLKVTEKQIKELQEYYCSENKDELKSFNLFENCCFQNKYELESFNLFEKRFIKTSLCPICQIRTFGYKNFFYFEEAREEKLEEFSEEVNGLDPIDAIMSPAASKLNFDEKMLYIYDMDLEKELTVDGETGEVRRIGE